MKSEVWWCVKDPDVGKLPWTAMESYNDAVHNCENEMKAKWRPWYRNGYRVVKIKATEV